jgi:hypothetical protein
VENFGPNVKMNMNRVICKVLGIAYIAFSGPQSPSLLVKTLLGDGLCLSLPRNSSNFKKEKSGFKN